MQINASARVMFGIELVKEALRHIPECGVSLSGMWMQMNMEMTNPSSYYAFVSIAFLVHPDVRLRATGDIWRHNDAWDEGSLVITLPGEVAWNVHGIMEDGIISIDKVEPA